MHESIATRRPEIAALCRRLAVRRLDVFGSATGEAFDESSSDADFLVEFQPDEDVDYFGAYFSLKEGLEDLLGRPVDLVMRGSIVNPYFRESIERTQEPLYAA